MVDFDESDKMIKISGKMNKSATNRGFSRYLILYFKISLD